jgi:DHA1 family bicyclomycin/chloramphenicol resistance-like MFS transporter
MNPNVPPLWRGRRWTLALLLAVLGMLGPFTVDTYLPAFGDIATSLQASPLQMQQTLSGYLLAYAAMNLFHGALSDSLGRRALVLWNTALFTLASAGCAMAGSIGTLLLYRVLQGATAGAGMVLARTVIRDLYAPADAQRAMSQVTIFFGVAPVLAPLLGGWLLAAAGWRAIFWFLAALGAAIWWANWRLLPETLPPAQRHPLQIGSLLRGYGQLLRHRRFLLLVLASGIPFNGFFLYVLAAPTFLGHHLGLAPTQFWWFFGFNVAGIMGGAWWSGRLAGALAPALQVRRGFALMGVAAVINIAVCAVLPPHVLWSMPPVGLFAFGWSLAVPAVTILALDQVPERRGTASSLQACISGVASALVAGVVVPLVMGSTLGLAWTSAAFWLVGLGAWAAALRRFP